MKTVAIAGLILIGFVVHHIFGIIRLKIGRKNG